MIETPKCECFTRKEEGQDWPRGQRVSDTIGSQIMSDASDYTLEALICEEGLDYVCATVVAGLLMLPEVHRQARDSVETGDINPEVLEVAALRLAEKLPDYIRQRAAIIASTGAEKQ